MRVAANSICGEQVAPVGQGYPPPRTSLVSLTGRMIVLCTSDWRQLPVAHEKRPSLSKAEGHFTLWGLCPARGQAG
jgi:hypothetical protein